jgi:fatty-acyl-CoA synthase
MGTGLNFASAWEEIADHQGDRPALRHGDSTVSWADFDDRASRLAAAFAKSGVGVGDNVACALFNRSEYLEAEFAAFKVRAAPCNVNYRYVENELAYLVENSEAKAVVFGDELTERFDHIQKKLSGVCLWAHVGAGECPDWAVPYENLIDATDPASRIERSGEDRWILYTGGTTGNPKGVMWPQENIITLIARALEPLGVALPGSADGVKLMVDSIAAAGATPHQIAAAPLMHGTAGLGALFTLFQGGSVRTLTGRSFDPVELWNTVQADRTTSISIVGDVFCRPMVDALDVSSGAGNPYDLSSLQVITSSGVMWSQGIKESLLSHAQAAGADLTLNDSLGASEGVGFASRQSKGEADTETATFMLGPNGAVFTDDGRRVAPGSGEVGLLAVTGPIPIGYYGDPVKTAETFREFEGRRWSVPGDFATLADDGTVTLLGRGSVSINTGGEKVFPEEVEEALKLNPEVVDATVVGVPDQTWGSAVTAVVQIADGETVTDEELIDSMRSLLSGYKLPKHLVRVDKLYRGPNGKADYKWASGVALAKLGIDP